MISALSTYAVETLGTHLNALSSKLSEVSFPLLTVLEAKEEIKRYKGFFDAWDIKRKKAQVNLAVSTVKALLSGKEPFYVCPVDVGRNEKALDEAGKEIKKRTPDAPFLIISRDSEKVTLLSYVPPLKVKPDLFTAKLWAEAVVACIEGRSNGTDTIARGHGPSVLHYDEALRVAHHFPKAYV
ncbi:hypothetical protein Zmor_012381 [Zophobas morio]|uniref:Uncharacterized protein n=2 Tax=Zophobas morio TaxID=2755281 RepID=A0AA38LYT6_9CUCU|nr:hypothetical protein Zmor_012381 [Zophobas morio]